MSAEIPWKVCGKDMPEIRKRINKNGKTSYYIRVSNGYDQYGQQQRTSMTWTPPEGMSEKRADNEAHRIAFDFEDKFRGGAVNASNIRTGEFIDIWMRDHVRRNCKKSTIHTYNQLLPRIKTAIGGIKLRELKAGHLNEFYRNLAEAGIPVMKRMRPTKAKEYIGKAGMSKSELASLMGISQSTLYRIIYGKSVTEDIAKKICAYFEVPVETLFVRDKEDDILSSNYILRYHACIKSMLGSACKWGYIDSNPAKRAEPPKKTKTEAAYLDENEVKDFIGHLAEEPMWFRAFVLFDLLTGLRKSEIVALCWSDLSKGSQMINVRHTAAYTPEDGWYIDTPKSKNSVRSLKLSDSAFAILTELRIWQDQQARKLGDVWNNSLDRIFVYDDGSPVIANTVTSHMRSFADKYGYPEIHPHSLRHTYASLMLANNTPLVIVSKRLGHADVSTTSNIYSHVIESAEELSLEVADALIDHKNGIL